MSETGRAVTEFLELNLLELENYELLAGYSDKGFKRLIANGRLGSSRDVRPIAGDVAHGYEKRSGIALLRFGELRQRGEFTAARFFEVRAWVEGVDLIEGFLSDSDFCKPGRARDPRGLSPVLRIELDRLCAEVRTDRAERARMLKELRDERRASV